MTAHLRVRAPALRAFGGGPTARVLLRQPAVRAAAVVAVAGPAYVAWGGARADAPLRLRVVALAIAVVLAMVWDDRTAPVVAATPVGLPAVLRGRAAVLVALVTTGWVVSAAVVAWRTDGAPVGGLAVEAVGLAAVLVAVVGVLVRGRLGEPVLGYPVPLLLGLLALASRLPDRVTLLAAGPDDPGWVAVQQRWAGLAVVAVAFAVWCARDPARATGLRRRGDRG